MDSSFLAGMTIEGTLRFRSQRNRARAVSEGAESPTHGVIPAPVEIHNHRRQSIEPTRRHQCLGTPALRAPRNAGAPSLDRPARVEVRARALPGGAVVTAARLAGLGVPLALNEGLADIAVAAGERQTGDQQDEDAGMKRMVLKSIKQHDRSPFPSRTH